MTMKKTFSVTMTKFKLYWPLTKSLQTGLLLSTGLAGFMTARCPVIHWYDFFNLTLSLFLAIAGSTILNMWYDRDIDARMARTCARPLPTGQVSPQEALRLGLILSIAGIGMAVLMKPIYGLLVSAGLFFDVVVYTFWLKRRSEWSIVLGGFSGAMPILAGRAFGMGRVDVVGIVLFLAILFWIPTHILTFAMRNAEDYRRAGIPTFVSKYGPKTARAIIAISSLIASQAIAAAGIMIGIQWGFVGFLGVLSAGLLILAITSVIRPSERVNFSLFKYASVYMLAAMVLLAL
jgi:protoheme IX farnesyltransferase